MTIPQLFKWFCKEQKIMHIIRNMYYVIHPYDIVYSPGGSIEYKYLTFDEFIEKRIKIYGFSYALQRVVDEYANKMRSTMSYSDFLDWHDKLFSEVLNRIFRKWEYFVSNNIIMDDKIQKNKIFKFNHWGNIENIRVISYDIKQGRINGYVKRDEIEMLYTIMLHELLDDDEKKLEIGFKIKRNRKLYNGKN